MIKINSHRLNKDNAVDFFQKWAQTDAAPVLPPNAMVAQVSDDEFTQAAIKAGYRTPEDLTKIRNWASSVVLSDAMYKRTSDETNQKIGWALGGASMGGLVGGLLGGGKGALAGTLIGTLAFAVMDYFGIGRSEAVNFVQDSIATRNLDKIREALKTDPGTYDKAIQATRTDDTAIYATAVELAVNPSALTQEQAIKLRTETIPNMQKKQMDTVYRDTVQASVAELRKNNPNMSVDNARRIAEKDADIAKAELQLQHLRDNQGFAPDTSDLPGGVAAGLYPEGTEQELQQKIKRLIAERSTIPYMPTAPATTAPATTAPATTAPAEATTAPAAPGVFASSDSLYATSPTDPERADFTSGAPKSVAEDVASMPPPAPAAPAASPIQWSEDGTALRSPPPSQEETAYFAKTAPKTTAPDLQHASDLAAGRTARRETDEVNRKNRRAAAEAAKDARAAATATEKPANTTPNQTIMEEIGRRAGEITIDDLMAQR